MADWVECHSSSEYAGRPKAFLWRAQRFEVELILKRWREPGSKCFRVQTLDNQVFNLYYHEDLDEWTVNQP
jgi:hypothetical protein